MKKLVSLVLACAMCLSLCACGKSEAVKNVEAMIDALGEITLDSKNAIVAIDEAYGALTEDEQKKVSNYTGYLASRDAYYTLALPGEWLSSNLDIWTVLGDSMEDFILNPDMTWEGEMCGFTTGTWSVSGGILSMVEATSGFEYYNLEVSMSRDVMGLRYPQSANDYAFLQSDDWDTYMSQCFLIVDLAEVDPNEYFGFAAYEHEEKNEWGELTGNSATYVLLQNKLYDQGWVYLDTVGDFAIEVLYPAYKGIYDDPDSDYVQETNYEAGSVTLTYHPFTSYIVSMSNTSDGERTTQYDITPEQLSLGRVKGKVVFVKSEYVNVTEDADGNGQRVLEWRGECPTAYYSGELLENHPY